ncbi:MAG: alpha-ketoglutarate decarboxylase [Bacteroidetes bacterium]|nr:alpha-ketoglutarate decarboxylase [Bacteroidota bacterium]
MSNKLTLITLLFFNVSFLFSQNDAIGNSSNYAFLIEDETTKQPPLSATLQTDFQQYWSFGGNIGLSFWNGGTDILLGPKAYYNISPKFLTGIGLTYIYSEFNGNINYHSNSFGGSILLAVRPVPFLQISAEYEGLQTNYSGYYSDDYFINALYFGLSYVTGPVSFGIRYDVLYDTTKSIYSSAWNPIVGFYF